MNVLQVLEKLGYHPHEAQIYLAALELGEATVTELAHHAEMARTTTQEVVEHLQKKGLLIPYLKKLRRYWVAQNPEKLLANLKANEQAFEGLLPELVARRKGSGNTPSVQIFSGLTEIKQIMDDIIESKHHIVALISMDDWFKFLGMDYTQDFIDRRRSHFLKIRMISPDSDTARRLKKNDEQELRHLKFLPSGMNLRGITNFIYGDKTAIISFNRREPTGILIHDADIAYANLLYFENLWRHSAEA